MPSVCLSLTRHGRAKNMRLFFFVCLFATALLSDGFFIRVFIRAMGISEMTTKEIFMELGMSQTQWSRQIHGVEPPRFLAKLSRLQSEKGSETVRWYHFLVCSEIGLPQEITRGAEIATALNGRGKRLMARMSVDSTAERQKA